MADSEFEEFRRHFDQLPQHIKAPAKCYTLVHDITPCDDAAAIFEGFLHSVESPLKKLLESLSSDEDEDVKLSSIPRLARISSNRSRQSSGDLTIRSSNIRSVRIDSTEATAAPPPPPPPMVTAPPPSAERKTERKRRKLPEIPKIHRDLESPCDSDVWPGTDGDSGNSTVHSPDGIKSSSPYIIPPEDSWTPSSSSSSQEQICAKAEQLEATHRGLHRFVPRHSDEIEIDIGDPIYVQHESDDSWCEGVNLRTRRQGIFPSAYVVDVDYTDFDPDGMQIRKERYVLQYLGSVETWSHKGENIICAAVERIRQISSAPHPKLCVLEISDHGLHVTDKAQADGHSLPYHDYFFALKNVSFCGFHPTEPQFLGFITKHPSEQRFACHVFEGKGSTRHVAEAIGRAFQRFCHKFVELAYPIHEFYME